MFKKTISFVLSVMLTVASFSATAISASARIDTRGEYTPSQSTETRRYYFMMPEDWKNEYAETCGIYWWDGTDPADPWPGYTANKTEFENIYYCDVPVDVSEFIWNNAFLGVEDLGDNMYYCLEQTERISTEYYEAGKSKYYPNGIDAETGFENMIYILDPKRTIEESIYDSYIPYVGEWYYYYGDGTYSWYPTKDEAVKAGKVFDSEYLVLEDVYEKPTEATEPSADATFSTEDTTGVDIDGDSDSYTPTKPSADTNADDKDNNGNNSNGSVQTGGASVACVMLTLLVTAVGVMYTLRKKEIFN